MTKPTMTTETANRQHPFEAAGLGQAPFHIYGWYRDVGPKPLGDGCSFVGSPGQPMGSCDYCGTGIAIVCQVRSADGKQFVVGCDCAEKVGVDACTVRKAVRDEAAVARREKIRANQEAARAVRLQEQRDRNGGLTDRELQQKQEAEAKAARAATAAVDNAWLIDVLREVAYESAFVASIIRDLQQQPLSDCSPRCRNILRDIYAKQHGRRSSKKYDAACDVFDSHK